MSRSVVSPCISWRKSSRSGQQGACVEVAGQPGAVLIRDSKDARGPVLRVGQKSFRTLVSDVRAGHHDTLR
ncbi:DUF397 domain-containing protein [Actinomadura macra]|uniref:DUF397 domain-containing protein n=1 Tax=Actinomadura macra TaxID=46164 RepID=UPI000A0612DA|nr:DUF397 domain-containing protein [Actinomadura macra]